VQMMDVAAGTHTIRVHEDGFAPAQMILDLWPSAVAPRLRVVLHPVARATETMMVAVPQVSAAPSRLPALVLPPPTGKPS
jgi:hypothetical protein